MESNKKKYINKDVHIRKINENDLDLLMVHKNKNKQFFFLKEDITMENQIKWFEYMKLQKENFMYVCLDDNNPFGCMGYRKIDDVIDVYNVMRFEESNVTMSKCLLSMINIIKQKYNNLKIQVIVLNDNPAIKWYEKNGFESVENKNNFVKMILKK